MEWGVKMYNHREYIWLNKKAKMNAKGLIFIIIQGKRLFVNFIVALGELLILLFIISPLLIDFFFYTKNVSFMLY